MTLRAALLLILLSAVCSQDVLAQSAKPLLVNPIATKVSQPDPAISNSVNDRAEPSVPIDADDDATTDPKRSTATQFRLERIPLVGGAELLTIFARLDGLRTEHNGAPEVPLVSVVRDTLSDDNPENDRLRYVWMLTYARPNLMKRIASAIPFLYQPVGNQTRAESGPPKPLIDLANTEHQTWNAFYWFGLQNIFFDGYGIPVKAATRTYRRNAADYRSG